VNIVRLRYFKAAAEFLSLRKAAEALGVSQPALSRQIQILEQELKAPLFRRDHKRMTLTEAGELLLARGQPILSAIDELKSDIGAITRHRKTHIHIGAIQSTLDHLLPTAIKEFRRRYDTIQLAVTGSRSSEVVEKVGRRVLDLGIIAMPVSDPRLSVIPLDRDPFLLVAPRSHRLAQLAHATMRDVVREPLMTFPSGFPIRDLIDAAAKTAQTELSVVIELESIEAIKALVRDGAGISLLPRSTLLCASSMRDIACVAMAGPAPVREILAVRNATDPLTPAMQYLLDAIAGALRVEPMGIGSALVSKPRSALREVPRLLEARRSAAAVR